MAAAATLTFGTDRTPQLVRVETRGGLPVTLCITPIGECLVVEVQREDRAEALARAYVVKVPRAGG